MIDPLPIIVFLAALTIFGWLAYSERQRSIQKDIDNYYQGLVELLRRTTDNPTVLRAIERRDVHMAQHKGHMAHCESIVCKRLNNYLGKEIRVMQDVRHHG